MKAGSGDILVGGDGRRLHLGELIKSGGAGSVFHVRGDPLSVAKVYHDDVDRPTYERKVEAMLTLSPQLPDIGEGARRYVQIAWPRTVLRDARGAFQGYLMPAVDIGATAELELVMQERQARSLGLPTGLGAKTTLAANLAAVIAELHRQHHRVVDLKPVNLRFYPASLYMAMLDCDGFSIQGEGERFPAPQFTIDYLAPEFHAGGVTVAGEEAQDRFALAVIVFQLLNFGIHPFTGRPQNERVPTDVPGRIAGRFYAYGLQPSAQLLPSPASGHQSLPADLRALFDRAFAGPAAARPSPLEWATLLRGYAQRSASRLVACAQDATHQHFAGLPCAACARAQLLAQSARAQAAAPPAHRRPLAPRGRAPRPAPPGARPTARKPKPVPPFKPLAGAPNPYPRTPPPLPVPWWKTAARGYHAAFGVRGWIFLLGLLWFGFQHGVDKLRGPEPPADTRDWSATPPSEVPNWMRATAPPSPTEPPAPEASALVPLPPPQAQVVHDAVVAVAQAMHAADQDGFARALTELRLLNGGADNREAGMDPDDVRFLRFARAYQPRGDVDLRAMLGLEALLSTHPYDAEAACEWGWLAMVVGDHRQALAAFERSLWANAEQACGWYGVAMLAGDESVSIGALARAYQLGAFSDRAQTDVNVFLTRVMAGAGIETPWRLERTQAAENAVSRMRR